MIVLPENVEYIIKTLEANGHKGYIVGGCVRDSIMKRQPEDWDIATDALPEDVMELFGPSIVLPTGIKHGTVTILYDGIQYEVTTFRTEGSYSDYRRPDFVHFTSNIEDDLKRRDFTINALAYNDEDGLIDIFGGQDDIKKRIIRCVGIPDERFNEDALRMLRAVRFSAQLGFEIERNTFNSIKANYTALSHISLERIKDEFNKIIMSDNLVNINYLLSTKLMKYIIPEIYEAYEAGFLPEKYTAYVIEMLKASEKDTAIRLALLIKNMAACRFMNNNAGDSETSNIAENILSRLKYDRITIERVKTMIKYYEVEISDDRKCILKLLKEVGENNFRDIMKVKEAVAKTNDIGQLKRVESAHSIFDEIIKGNLCFSRKQLELSGEDLKGIGIPPGKLMGEIIDELVDLVIENPQFNKKEILMEYVKSKTHLD